MMDQRYLQPFYDLGTGIFIYCVVRLRSVNRFRRDSVFFLQVMRICRIWVPQT